MAEALVVRASPLTAIRTAPGMATGSRTEAGEVVAGPWSLTRASFTDRHEHVEINVVLEGELVVTVDGVATTLGPGDTIAVPAGTVARYEAPVHAHMIYIYGPGPRGATTVLDQDLGR